MDTKKQTEKKTQSIDAKITSVLRKGMICKTQKTMDVVTRCMIKGCGIAEIIGQWDRDYIKRARLEDGDAVSPSKKNPLTRIVRARIQQLGAHPTRELVGLLQARLLKECGFDKWVAAQEADRFDKVWDAISPPKNSDSTPEGAKSAKKPSVAKSSGAATESPAADDTLPLDLGGNANEVPV